MSRDSVTEEVVADVYPITPHIVRLFWDRVKQTEGCWWWTGTLAGHQRIPHLHIRRRREGIDAKWIASRLSWAIHHDQEIPNGLFVCHHCDHPACVRPDHL